MTIKKLERQINAFNDRIKSNEREVIEAEDELKWVKFFADANSDCCKLRLLKIEQQLWVEKILRLCNTGE